MIPLTLEQEAQLTKLIEDLEVRVQDAYDDNPEIEQDDVAHDIAVSMCYDITDADVLSEFCRVQGMINPITGDDPLAGV